MKRVGIVVSLLLFMVLGGCLGKKTEQQLSQGAGNNGGPSGVVTADYAFTSSLSTERNKVDGAYFSFEYKTNNELINTPVGGTEFTITPKGAIIPYIKVKSINGVSVNLSNEAITLSNSTVPQGVITKKSEGKILFAGKYSGTYQKGEIIKEGKKYIYIVATVPVSTELVSGTSNTYSYIVSSVVEDSKISDLVYFEDIIRTMAFGEVKVVQNLETQTQLIKKLSDLNSSGNNYLDDTKKEEIYKAIEDFYLYVEKVYVSPSVSSNEKRSQAVEYVLKNSFDYIESPTTTVKKSGIDGVILNLFSKIKMAYRYDLENEIATAENLFKGTTVVDVFPNLDKLEKSLNVLIDSKIKQDSMREYIYNKEFWKNVVISELRNDSKVQSAIEYIIIGNLGDIRVNKLGETTYPNKELQPLYSYEEQMLKITKYASYEFYKQEYFLPKNTDIDKQLNIEDYLMIKGAEKMKLNATTIGKSELTKGTTSPRIVKELYEKAYGKIIDAKLEILSLTNKTYFDKIETAKANQGDSLKNLTLLAERQDISNELKDLANSVKIYDVISGVLDTSELEDLKNLSTFKLTSDFVLDKIQNKTSPNYLNKDYPIPTLTIASTKYIDSKTLASYLSKVLDEANDNTDYNGDGDKTDKWALYDWVNTGVKTGLILSKYEIKYQ